MIGFFGVAALSFVAVGAYRWLALRHRWLDNPNERSSHTVITPRGAGIVLAVLIVGAGYAVLHSQCALFWPLIPGLIIAATGFWDDMRGVSARVRFWFYFVNAAIAVALIFTRQTAVLPPGFVVSLPLLYGAFATVGLLWLINLYNFMDGINGIAACEALFVLIAIGFLADESNYGRAFEAIHIFAAAVIIGFLAWNFPLGKVFMGDAGSAFLGFFLGSLTLWSAQLNGPTPAVWSILLGVFVVDSSYTLAVRMMTKQAWHSAHRLHAYQRLTDRFSGSHARVVGALMAVNIGWLLPMAWLVQIAKINTFTGIVLAYIPLIAACRWLKAGIPARGAL